MPATTRTRPVLPLALTLLTDESSSETTSPADLRFDAEQQLTVDAAGNPHPVHGLATTISSGPTAGSDADPAVTNLW